MSATVLYRISSVLFLIFAIAHTLGVLNRKAPSPEVAAVRTGMDTISWRFMGSNVTYGGMFVGFGLLVTAALLVAAYFAWHLGELARVNPQAIGMMGWVLFAFSLFCLVLGWVYFFAGPMIISALIAGGLGWASWLVTAARR